ncbi:MAG TPA: exodeoxyribonuclease VII large subunit [Acidimicrobiales bacterium]|nr:exodeoxyribonuclease VII large subunit [Acidimicrobiales bacterium]
MGLPARQVRQRAESHETREERPSDSALSIGQLYNRIRAALAQALPGEVWVVGEIRKVQERKGHRYLELADHDPSPGAPLQQLQVVCWSREWRRISAELARASACLEEGRVVRVRGRVGVWEGGGKLSLSLTALDVEALLGGIAVARQRLLRQLAEEGLAEANRRRALSLVPLRIGLVTSEGSEAHRDFAGCLERSGYAFDLRVERSLVQGPHAPWLIAAALRRICRGELDLVVVVRGGGGRGDLAAFDSDQVARAIATAPVPVWVGVGHSGDRSVADEVAHASFSTPTACGEALVARVEGYWAGVSRAAAALASRASARLDAAVERVGRSRSMLSGMARHQLGRRADELAARRARLGAAVTRTVGHETGELGLLADRLARCARTAAQEEAHSVRRCREVLRAYDPQRQLERGWSLTRDESGRIVRSLDQLARGELVRTAVADGEIEARVEQLLRPAPTPGAVER